MLIETTNRVNGKPAKECNSVDHRLNCYKHHLTVVLDQYGDVMGYRKKDPDHGRELRMRRLWDVLILILLIIAIFAAPIITYRYLLDLKTEGTAEQITGEPIKEEILEEEVVITAEASLSDEDIIARAVMAEAGNQEMIGKVAVAETILNRAELWGKTVMEIVTQENQYAWPYYGIITEECYEAARIAISERDLFPRNMIYFRTKNYHSFGIPYMQIGDHYFSLEEEE